MRRVHLFEFEDQEWFPSFLRDYITDFLQFVSNTAKIYKPVVPLFTQKIKATQTHQLIDLASGGGGGLLWLSSELQKEIPGLKIRLTDYFPNLPAFKRTKSKAANIDFETVSVDARNVPAHLKGFRTQFLSFHHFKPDDAVAILQNAVNSNSPIAIFESQDRSLLSITAMLLSPLNVLLTTPFIRPFKPGRILFTYLIPIVPVCVLWDGLVSSFRTYSVREMQELLDKVDNKDSFQWDLGKEKNVLYLTGIPQNTFRPA